MSEKRRILYLSATVNFIFGIVIGIILFYGQLKSADNEVLSVCKYDKNATLADFLRLSWLNIVWLLSVFFARCILPVGAFHPIVAIRGTISSFSILYILTLFGIREAATTIVPQCFSVLPLLLFFSVETVEKHRNNIQNGLEPCSLKRNEIATIFVLGILAAASEVLIFRVFCKYLF